MTLFSPSDCVLAKALVIATICYYNMLSSSGFPLQHAPSIINDTDAYQGDSSDGEQIDHGIPTNTSRDNPDNIESLSSDERISTTGENHTQSYPDETRLRSDGTASGSDDSLEKEPKEQETNGMTSGHLVVKMPCGPYMNDVTRYTISKLFDGRFLSTEKQDDDDAIDKVFVPNTESSPNSEEHLARNSHHSEADIMSTAETPLESGDPHKQTSRKVQKRATRDETPWHCRPEYIWDDMGPDYYPRYIRRVICSHNSCFNPFYGCMERYVTIKILRRTNTACRPVYDVPVARDGSMKASPIGPIRYEQDWVFEERSQPLACECARILY